MPGLTEKGVRVLLSIRDRIKANPRVRKALYNVQNAHQFSGLYEHDIMLADQVRTRTYHRAIARYVKPGDLVVDLGTGNGILSFFASMSGAEKVYALDHSDIIEKAEAVALDNGLTNIEFIRTHSRDFVLPEGKADVIVHEQIGDLLLNENMIANLVDLRDRVLKPGGRILPARFELFIEPVQMTDAHRVPFIWEQRIEGIDFNALRKFQPELPRHYFHANVRPSDIQHLLSEPTPILAIDVETLELAELPLRMRIVRDVTEYGRLDAFVLYFSVIFDDEIRFDTAPSSPETHWASTVLRVEATNVTVGDVIELDLTIDDITEITTWRWNYTARRAA
jgi:protein arginine N-methyltransferase 1